MQSCEILTNGFQGIYGFTASNGVISGNVIRWNNYKGKSSASAAGLTLDSCTGMSAAGNNFFSSGDDRRTYSYEAVTAKAGNIFIGNVSMASQNTTGNWVIAFGTASPHCRLPGRLQRRLGLLQGWLHCGHEQRSQLRGVLRRDMGCISPDYRPVSEGRAVVCWGAEPCACVYVCLARLGGYLAVSVRVSVPGAGDG